MMQVWQPLCHPPLQHAARRVTVSGSKQRRVISSSAQQFLVGWFVIFSGHRAWHRGGVMALGTGKVQHDSPLQGFHYEPQPPPPKKKTKQWHDRINMPKKMP